jgi:beta-lactamase regulating signal transducer with metallopeptidase domain
MSEWLIDTLLATSALMALVLIVREPVRKRFGSRVTYGLWLIPAARLFMPTLTHTVHRTVAPVPALRPLTDPLVRESLWMARVTPPEPSLLDRIGGWPSLLVAIWAAVAMGLFLSRMIAFCRDRRAILDSSAEVTRIGAVRILETPEVLSPVALGIIRPIIAVPANFHRSYPARERRLVLDHELSHHRSGDLVANLFAFVLLCLQWFNPLAWVAHAAFRFDQEAACDARVLDKATAADRADYGRAIARAASGRALLFASALDRRNSLHRRLKSMLRSSSPSRRLAGRLMVVGAIAVALPLTASRAVDYIDVPAAAPLPPVQPVPVVPVTAAVAVQPAQAPGAVAPAAVPARAPAERARGHDDLTIDRDYIVIDGKKKRWEELTPAEKARVSAEVAKAREALANTHIDQAKIMQDVARARDEVNMDRIQRELANSKTGVAEALRNLDENQRYIRAAGQDPEQMKAAIREAMESLRTIDPEQIKRDIGAVDPQRIAAEVAGAQESMRAAKAELDRLQARIDADRQH